MDDPVSIGKGTYLGTSKQAMLDKWSLQVAEVLLAPGSLLNQSLDLYPSNALD